MNKQNIMQNIVEFNNTIEKYDQFIIKNINSNYMFKKLKEYHNKVRMKELNMWATLPDKGVIVEERIDKNSKIPTKRYFIYDSINDYVDVYCETANIFGFSARFRFSGEIKNGVTYYKPLVANHNQNGLVQELGMLLCSYLSYIDCLNSVKITELRENIKEIRSDEKYIKNQYSKNNNLIVITDKKIEYPERSNTGIQKRNYSRKTNSWCVKGFYRHYKNGKVVFVKSYQKGKGETNPRKYLIK